ncbi:Histone-lysine N-methyltransferase SETMAR [Araneus ventricosus]|uniref:Histone-lysine N-methyltransferase SETMAR n=1 Tax=Araneus ventricosus TaxID=182803 RepID=A0A4Y2UVG7_ARAVE|nr:Histone-lysine N-methyltransferase SETMAR [Araneus ventricosus]
MMVREEEGRQEIGRHMAKPAGVFPLNFLVYFPKKGAISPPSPRWLKKFEPIVVIKVWFRKFKAGNFDIEDEPRSGRPIEVDFKALKLINLIIKFNRWVPHELTAEDKRKRKEGCLARIRDQKKEKILDRIVTCDEKWMYYNNTSRKGRWSAPAESARSVVRRALNNQKVFICIWWHCRAIIYKEHLKSWKTINSAIYSNILIKVRNAIRGKRRNEFRRKVVLFHQDNALPHVKYDARLGALQAGVRFDGTFTIQPRHGPFVFLPVFTSAAAS